MVADPSVLCDIVSRFLYNKNEIPQLTEVILIGLVRKQLQQRYKFCVLLVLSQLLRTHKTRIVLQAIRLDLLDIWQLY